MYDFGQTLKEKRKSKSMTQKRLAELLEVSETNICKYESNIVFPSFDKLRTLSAVLNVSLDELCGTQARETVSLMGLNEEQSNIIKDLIIAFRTYNNDNKKQLSNDNLALIGKITTLFSK